MSPSIKYGLLNSAVGLAVGIIVMGISIGSGYSIFVIGAPIAAFLTSVLIWKIFDRLKLNLNPGRIIISGILSGSISHYFCWLLLSIGLNLCYAAGLGCTDSLGGPPASVIDMLTGALAFSIFSLMFFGWITIPAAIIIGFYIRRKIIRQKHIEDAFIPPQGE